ncbi:flagellar basal body protein [Thermomonas sp. S9]|uniref:flagellar basal body protein n=1 Tax=Thermomonas sp. S9 TaxID=2885203 RepID=UPI00216B5773|nr:flagellar basal body protein [Thermomonas sp. S9]MCR6495687.1 flagellar basal body protein [Thermomonas sp. S9]
MIPLPVSTSTIARSGMQAAAQRMQVAASNTANRHTDGFERRDAVQTASPDGGVQTRIVPSGASNDAIGAQLSDAIAARRAALDFAANAAAFRARNDAIGTLFDALA